MPTRKVQMTSNKDVDIYIFFFGKSLKLVIYNIIEGDESIILLRI